jgi:hypothetical protein
LILFDPEWSQAFDSGSTTSLINLGLEPLGNARYFFIFVLSWSLVSNNIVNLYSISLSVQLLGNWATKVPRFLWTFLASILITVLSIVGRNSFVNVLNNLVAVIGYWSVAYFAVYALEYDVFRPWLGARRSDLDSWNDKKAMSWGIAGLVSFGIGIAGAVLGMSQTWYTGYVRFTSFYLSDVVAPGIFNLHGEYANWLCRRIAALIGEFGGDLGMQLAFSFALLTYPLLRYIEIQYFTQWSGVKEA